MCDFVFDLSCVKSHAAKMAALLKAVANERRLLILCALSQGEKSVTELEDMINISQSALSQHLAKLREESLVTGRRQAQTIFYSISNPALAELMGCLEKISKRF